MLLSRIASIGVLLSVAAGCASSSSSSVESEEVGESAASELRLSNAVALGAIAAGETKTTTARNGSPTYRAYSFEAASADLIQIDVGATAGTPLAWITDTSFHILATSQATTMARASVTYAVPAGASASTYLVVFRTASKVATTFAVSLSNESPSVRCEYGGTSYKPGDTFPSSDQCTNCACDADGTVSCIPRIYVGTPDQCALLRYKCDPGQVPFTSVCGCGCEPE